MLDAAVNLLIQSLEDRSDDALAWAVAHVRVTDVVAEASKLAAADLGLEPDDYLPLSIGALYQIWPNQAEFQSAVLLHLGALGSTVVPSVEDTQDLIDRGIRGSELLHLTVRQAWEHTRADPIFRATLVAYPRIGNDDIRSIVAGGYEQFILAVSEAWQLTLEAAGRRVTPPHTEEHLARSVAALIEGFALQWLADPTVLDDPFGTSDWDLVTRSAVALVDVLTEPIPND